MDGNEFAKHLLDISKEIEKYIDNDTPEIMGVMARDHFKEAFQEGTEGFTDKSLEKWPNVKRRTNPKNFHYITKGPNKGDKISGNAYAARAILTGDTGDLGFSIDYETKGNGEVTVYSDKEYAEAHNEGTANAGRNRNVTIPKRQFIGDSEVLNEKIAKRLENDIDNIMNR